MIERTVREGLSLVGWTVLVAAAFVVNGIIVFANYVGAKTSLELSNYGMAPLDSDRLIGRWVGAFFGEATIADFLAAGMAIGIGMFAFIACKVIFQVPRFIEQLRAYRANHDLESSRIVGVRLVVELCVFAALGTGLVLVWLWDIGLFRFRSLAEGFNLHDPVAAAATVANWEESVAEHGGLFIVELAELGGRGYLALALVGCLSLEYCLYKAAIVGGQFLRAVMAIFADPDDEIGVASVRFHTGANAPEPGVALSGNNDPDQEPLFDDIPAPVATPAAATGHGTDASDEPVEVLGSPAPVSIRPSEARRNPEVYYVDDVSGAVWDSVYWRSLHEDAGPGTAKAA